MDQQKIVNKALQDLIKSLGTECQSYIFHVVSNKSNVWITTRIPAIVLVLSRRLDIIRFWKVSSA